MTTTEVNLATKYQKKTDIEHILSNPDTYIGSVEEVDTDLWILNKTDDKIIEKNIKYIPGLFKLFDEGIVNCRDHVIRMIQATKNGQQNCLPVSNIEITIDDDGTITMLNDGNGIDVAEHPEHKMWIPEMIFGHLRTSTNYDKTEKKIVGGMKNNKDLNKKMVKPYGKNIMWIIGETNLFSDIRVPFRISGAKSVQVNMNFHSNLSYLKIRQPH